MMHPTSLTIPAIVLAALVVLPGCGAPHGEAVLSPLHVQVICVGSEGGEWASCRNPRARAAYESWSNRAIHLPGSTFSLWVVGQSRRDVRRRFAVCIPDSWGHSVGHAKALFLRESRDRFAAMDSSSTDVELPEGCSPRVSASSNNVTLEVIPSDGSAQEPVFHMANAVPSSSAHFAVVCDASDSGLGVTCNRETLTRSYEEWMRLGPFSATSTFRVYAVGSSRDSARTIFSITVPGDVGGIGPATMIAAAGELAGSVPTDKRVPGSAIAEAVQIAASDLNELEGGRYLRILSDGRQVTPNRWNFESEIPQAPRFIDWLEKSDLAVDLSHIDVQMCGLHHERGPGARQFDANDEARLRSAWKEAFASMRASGARLMSSCGLS